MIGVQNGQFEGRLDGITFGDQQDVGAFLAGLCRCEADDWNLDLGDLMVALNRQPDNSYEGSFSLERFPQTLRQIIEQSSGPQLPAAGGLTLPSLVASGSATVTPPEALVPTEAAISRAETADVPTAASISPPSSAAIALRFQDAIRHSDAIKEFVGAYVVKSEPTEYERAILKALQVEVDKISRLLQLALDSPAPPSGAIVEQTEIRTAASRIELLWQAAVGLESVMELAQHLEGLLRSIGVL